MKKTFIALLALSSMSFADTLTLYDQWTFDTNLTSTEGRTFTKQAVGTTFSDGALSLTLNNSGTSGLHLQDAAALGLNGGDWALQITCSIPTGNTTGTAQVLTCLNNVQGGTMLAISNPAQNNVYGYTGTGWSGWGGNNLSNTVAAINTPVTLTLMNYNGTLYLAQNGDWATFGTSQYEGASAGDKNLNKLTLGFGQNGQNGLTAQTITVDDISVYTFNHQAVSLAEVKSALTTPEPTTGTLSLLALAGLCARRRRK